MRTRFTWDWNHFQPKWNGLSLCCFEHRQDTALPWGHTTIPIFQLFEGSQYEHFFQSFPENALNAHSFSLKLYYQYFAEKLFFHDSFLQHFKLILELDHKFFWKLFWKSHILFFLRYLIELEFLSIQSHFWEVLLIQFSKRLFSERFNRDSFLILHR